MTQGQAQRLIQKETQNAGPGTTTTEQTKRSIAAKGEEKGMRMYLFQIAQILQLFHYY